MDDLKEKEDLVAYCGLYCGDCHGYTGRIPDLARDLRRELRKSRYDRFADFMSNYSFASAFSDYQQCYRLLGQMVRFRCKAGCRAGGGPPFCKIRKCAQRKGLSGCWECDEFETCKELEFLKPVHGAAHIRNLKTIRKKGSRQFIQGKRYWYSEV
jgi:hypothetical protein